MRAVRGVRVNRQAFGATEERRKRDMQQEEDKKRKQKQAEEEKERKGQVSMGPGLGEFLFGAKGFKNVAVDGRGGVPACKKEVNSDNNITHDVLDETKLAQSFSDALKLDLAPPEPEATRQKNQPDEPWPEKLPDPFPLLYLADAEYETLDPMPSPAHHSYYSSVGDDVGSGNRMSTSVGKEDPYAFESTMDSDFQKFADRVGQSPEQAIRYEFAGQPLLYRKTDQVGRILARRQDGGDGGGMPRCEACGAERVFEVQLMPHAIAELEAETMSVDGMDWGTIVVGVCAADCFMREEEPGYFEEWAGVQWEDAGR